MLLSRLVFLTSCFCLQAAKQSTMSATHKIKRKHFDNPYNDYAPEEAQDILDCQVLKDSCRIVRHLPDRWNSTQEKLKKLKKNDSSVYTGTAGVALLYLRKAPHDKEFLKEAKSLLQTSTIKSKRRVTFLCGDGGPLAIGAVVTDRLGELAESKNLTKALISLKTDVVNYKSDLPSEYLYGRAGYLYSLMYVNKHISPPPIEECVIKSVIEAIFKAGQKYAKEGNFSSPLMYEWHDSLYLGAAHGLTGIVYLLLQVREYLTPEDLELLKGTVEFLVKLQYPSGNFPSSLDSQNGDKYVQWCHGAPGFVYMFSIAYKVYEDQRYLDLALKAGDVIWNRGLLRKGYSICHGVSGNAYCFLELYQTTKDPKHLYRAARFAEWCIDYTKEHEEHSPDRPLSLYEGICGPMYLLLDMQNPMEAKFPGFTL